MSSDNIMKILLDRIEELEMENKLLRTKIVELSSNVSTLKSHTVSLSQLTAQAPDRHNDRHSPDIEKAVDALIKYGKAVGL